MNLAEFIIAVESYNANIDIALVRKAYEFSDRVHAGQFRESGDPFVEHCLNVAFILAEQHMDSATIAAGLLHDAIEDAGATVEEIKGEFGEEIAQLVDGLTKMSELKFKSLAEQQVEYFRKMLLSMAKDIRVIVIKLADRLHNMRTLEHLPEEKRKRIALETREIYAPLAHRFGMARVRFELEDLAFKYLNSKEYAEIERKITESRDEREAYIKDLTIPLKAALESANIKAEITGRAKHSYSIYRKIVHRGVPFEQIYDFLAMRVVVDTITECYHALGIIHTMWAPVPDRFHDYIANPKSNMYRSMHTTVIGPRGKMIEIQIRTHAMHYTAEYGIAAHWLYKEGKKTQGELDRQMAWLREILEWQREMTNPEEFMEYLKVDLFQEDIFVYTPAGELKQLPRGSTPLDFAFVVHSDVGFHCVGAKVNGKFVPLTTRLESGDEIEIKTSPHQAPSQDWLKIVRTTRAKTKIKHWLKQKGFEQSILLGKEMFERELKKHRLALLTETEMSDLAAMNGFTNTEQMLSAIGSGSTSLQTLINKIAPPEPEKGEPSLVKRFIDQARGTSRGVRVAGVGNLMYRFASCCQPVPGERIIGFVTRGRGLSIHRADCQNAVAILEEPERRVDVEWDVEKGQSFLVRLYALVNDRKNILKDITEAISDVDINVRGGEIAVGQSPAIGHFVVEIQNYSQLSKALDKIRHVNGVLSVDREGISDFNKG
ncbi:MAG TPA: (p)ppGpp synthetase [candidate division Zixibacteria bacterium]|nr:(p)ppGpp synthetase [candidate division Zixibacteria bacterium]HBZ01717.1 (p)ppGpp synthetase [candidate division Zixibacteria bacterium]